MDLNDSRGFLCLCPLSTISCNWLPSIQTHALRGCVLAQRANIGFPFGSGPFGQLIFVWEINTVTTRFWGSEAEGVSADEGRELANWKPPSAPARGRSGPGAFLMKLAARFIQGGEQPMFLWCIASVLSSNIRPEIHPYMIVAVTGEVRMQKANI